MDSQPIPRVEVGGPGAARRPPRHPWGDNVLPKLRNVLRFALWVCLVVNALMLAFFTILFSYQFLTHLWGWCRRVLFDGSW